MKKLLLLLCLLPLGLFAQTTIKPDCTISFNFTTTASTSNLTCGNNTQGIVNWIVVYSSTGFTGLSLEFQSAPDAGGTPGTWVSFAGTVLSSTQYVGSSGINPNTSTTAAFTGFAGYFQWNRVTLLSITGTGRVTGNAYGFLNSTLATAGGGGGGGGSGCTAPCAVEGTAAAGSPPSGPPVLVGGSDGTDVRTLLTDASGRLITSSTTATSELAVSVSSSGLTQILAASAGKVITIYHFSIGMASSVNFQLEYGTGSNCGTGTTAATGVYQVIQGLALDVPFSLPASQALCVNLGSGVVGGGLLVYTQI